MASLLLGGGVVAPLHAQDSETPQVTVGAGIQTSFLHYEPDDADGTDSFRLNSLRLYVNGSATDNIKFMLNTDISYGGSLGAPDSNQNTDVQILDAAAQIEISDKFNVWVGRFLPPSDRANLHGPFYGSPKVRVGHCANRTRGGRSRMLVQQSMIIPMSADAEWKP